MQKYVIIVAGGSGTRMKSSVPKQFLLLKGKPVLMHTIKAFFNYDPSMKLIVALPKNLIETWKEMCLSYNFLTQHELVAGGETRFHSVKNALSLIDDDGLVAVHDGVRPLVGCTTLKNCFVTAELTGNAVPCIDVPDSMRFSSGGANQPVNRNNYKLIQTPQVFQSSLILEAYKQGFNESFTDDASVVEELGIKINLVEGNRENIKITHPADIRMAEGIMKVEVD